MSERENVHATGLVIGHAGVLLRGPSGSGKSLLALDLLDWAAMRGLDAFLVADDRVLLSVEDGVVVMRSPAGIAGLIELRGRGIVRRAHRQTARVSLVVDIVDDLERMPAQSAFSTTVSDVTIARCPVPRRGGVDAVHQRLLITEALAAGDYLLGSPRQKTT